MAIDELIPNGKTLWFEYHCWESDNSADAELWHHSHQKVVVLKCTNSNEYGDMAADERYDGATLLAYKVKFADGFVAEAMEDELMTNKKDFCRPDPPQRRKNVS